jgi:hypothetical protein
MKPIQEVKITAQSEGARWPTPPSPLHDETRLELFVYELMNTIHSCTHKKQRRCLIPRESDLLKQLQQD